MRYFLSVLTTVIVVVLCVSCLLFMVAKTSDHARNEYSYKNCIERYVIYDKVAVDTAKINCKKVWKE